jgi:hypothetical protein
LPPFSATTHSVTTKALGLTWHPGCPVGPDQLRMMVLSYKGMDGQAHQGQLVVNADRVDELIKIFGHLYQMRYPIAKMFTPDHYVNADDELSMEDNNTSGYNCREIPDTDRWSYHAYGRAIDINPLINPYHDVMARSPRTVGHTSIGRGGIPVCCTTATRQFWRLPTVAGLGAATGPTRSTTNISSCGSQHLTIFWPPPGADRTVRLWNVSDPAHPTALGQPRRRMAVLLKGRTQPGGRGPARAGGRIEWRWHTPSDERRLVGERPTVTTRRVEPHRHLDHEIVSVVS